MFEGRVWICAGTRRDGQRCEDKVSHAAGANHIQSQRLPVCKRHISQILPCVVGRCQSDDEHGVRCFEMAIAQVGHNLVCTAHEDAKLPCRFMQAPTELRLLVYKRVLPTRAIFPSTMGLESQDLATARALLLTNHKVSMEVSSAFYNSRQYPCRVHVNNEQVLLHQHIFAPSAVVQIGSDTSDIMQLARHRFGPFKHFQVHFDISVAARDEEVFAVLEMSR